VGLGFLVPNTKYLLPLTAVFLLLAVGMLAFRARRRRGYGPFILGVAASSLILFGKFSLTSNPVFYAGLGLLILASVWNTWPAASYCACAPAEGKLRQPGVQSERKIQMTTNNRKVEVFSAGCQVCNETIAVVRKLACGSCEVVVQDMHNPEVAAKAKQYGVRSLPAVVIDGKLANCCLARGPEESVLRAAGIGNALVPKFS
jgi:glutaredoxin